MFNELHVFLANIWFFIIWLIFFLYIVVDGFDLGVGILFLLNRDEKQRTIMMASLGSVWDANETWLVLLIGALFGAFPLVYAIVLHALYIPVMLMIFALIFRGVAFEFRSHAHNKVLWNMAFGGGSLLAAIAQGLAFGGLISGLNANGTGLDVGWAWLTPFSLLVAIGVVVGYGLLGATYLIIKTEGDLQRISIRHAYVSSIFGISIGIAVIIWTLQSNPYVAARWDDFASRVSLDFFLGLISFAFLMLIRALRRGFETSPFFWSIFFFFASFMGMTIGYYPYMIPSSITLIEAASSSKTLIFMLTGIGFLVPVMLIYNGYQYLVFWGKVRMDEDTDAS
jgi:cytochrome d ubiquinol oxidase subunit II